MIQSPSILLMIAAFLLVLGPLVVAHELGHYLVGRWFGVKADVFSIGFGKELFGRNDKRGTRWRVAALPLGGYVQFAGDANAASIPDPAHVHEPGSFHAAPLWHRALIVLAGPVTNFFLAIAIFAGFNMIYGKPVISAEIGAFAPGSAAQAAGLKVGDRIVTVEGERIEGFGDLLRTIAPYPGRTVTIEAIRAGRTVAVPVRIATVIDRDRFGNEARVGRIGIPPFEPRIVAVGPIEAVTLAGEQSWGIVKMMVTGIAQIVSGERSVKELGGPIKIAKYSGEQLSLGWPQFVWFAALISINLGFINLLPIPTLDGGHLAFYAAEAVRRKPVGVRGQEWAFRTGLAFVLALMLFVTINDLASLNLFGR